MPCAQYEDNKFTSKPRKLFEMKNLFTI